MLSIIDFSFSVSKWALDTFNKGLDQQDILRNKTSHYVGNKVIHYLRYFSVIVSLIISYYKYNKPIH
jgi:hypothetical protein